MAGYSPYLPLTTDAIDGIKLTKTYKEVAKQNLKMLLLTFPGEKVMDPEFGIGAQSHLFENHTPATVEKITADLKKQVQKYLPYLKILNLNAVTDPLKTNDLNSLVMSVEYEIITIGIFDTLNIIFDTSPKII